jgi:hypothetical protein
MGFVGISMIIVLFGLVGAVKFLSEFAVEMLNEIEIQAQQRRRDRYNQMASV